MKMVTLNQNIDALKFQRNAFLAINLLLLISVIMLTICVMTKQERVIVTPPVLEKEFWVDASSVSPSYLEQHALFVGQLLLNRTQESAIKHRELLLRHTDNRYVKCLKEKLEKEEEQLKLKDASYIFFPIDITVDTQLMRAKITGDRAIYVGDHQLGSNRESYTLSFSYNGSQLLLQEIFADGGDNV